jgi:hypothetical protein
VPQTLPRIAKADSPLPVAGEARQYNRSVIKALILAKVVLVADTLLSVMRFECGGHHEQAAGK